MKKVNYLEIEGRSSGFMLLLGVLGVIILGRIKNQPIQKGI